jgi:hypothetical protein
MATPMCGGKVGVCSSMKKVFSNLTEISGLLFPQDVFIFDFWLYDLSN